MTPYQERTSTQHAEFIKIVSTVSGILRKHHGLTGCKESAPNKRINSHQQLEAK